MDFVSGRLQIKLDRDGIENGSHKKELMDL